MVSKGFFILKLWIGFQPLFFGGSDRKSKQFSPGQILKNFSPLDWTEELVSIFCRRGGSANYWIPDIFSVKNTLKRRLVSLRLFVGVFYRLRLKPDYFMTSVPKSDYCWAVRLF
jgi:hypothetical protein